MDSILGLIGFCIGIFFLTALMKKYENLNFILLIGFLTRSFFSFYHTYINLLPDNLDPTKFENRAWVYGGRGFFEAIIGFGDLGSSYTYSHFVSIIYSLIGRSQFFIQMIHVTFGLFNIILTYKLSFQIWNNEKVSKLASWAICLFPTVIMYSALTNREVFISFFLLLSSINIVKWIKQNNLKHFLLAFAFFIPHYFLHGPLIVGAFVLVGIFIVSEFNKGLKALSLGRINFNFIAILISLVILFWSFGFFLTGFSIPYISNNLKDINLTLIFEQAIYLNTGGAAYPDWLLPNEYFDFLSLTFPRIIYFFFSPFPWDVRKLNQLLGLIDSFIYMYLIYHIYKGFILRRSVLKLNKFFVILGVLFIVYSWGVSNYGTGLRHRAKFAPVLVALASSGFYGLKLNLKRNQQ